MTEARMAVYCQRLSEFEPDEVEEAILATLDSWQIANTLPTVGYIRNKLPMRAIARTMGGGGFFQD